ncbi:MAG: alpha/beta hydrolase [Thermoguttaceae bacterium]
MVQLTRDLWRPGILAALLACLCALTTASAVGAERPLTISVWPGPAPGEKGDIGPEHLQPPQKEPKPIQRLTDVSKPTITVYPPARHAGPTTAVLICPGGGYSILAMDLEGTEVADWLNSIGATGVVLKYRVPARKDQPKHLAPLQDAQRAMSLVRAHAGEWNIRPDRIGVLGFSAGGHLAAATATNHQRRQYAPLDEVDKISCRPDFAVLIYPAYLTAGDRLAAEIAVDAKSPPTFFAHAGNDGISADNSITMYRALRKANVAAELHVYTLGGHGFGLRPSGNPCCTWPQRCEQWMKSSALLDK